MTKKEAFTPMEKALTMSDKQCLTYRSISLPNFADPAVKKNKG